MSIHTVDRCCTVILCFVASTRNVDSPSQSTGNEPVCLDISLVIISTYGCLPRANHPVCLATAWRVTVLRLCAGTPSCPHVDIPLRWSLQFVYSQQLQKFNSPGHLSIINIDPKSNNFHWMLLCFISTRYDVISALTLSSLDKC